MIGVVLCILSAVPVLVLGVLDEEGMLAIFGVIFCLIIISAGVFFLVRTCVISALSRNSWKKGITVATRNWRTKKRNSYRSVLVYCHGGVPGLELLYNGMASHVDHLALCGGAVRRSARYQRSGT